MEHIFPIPRNSYPSHLREINHSPERLFVRGDPAALSLPCIAIVGTRRPTPYGIRVTREITSALAHQGFCIVSGLAYGIDACAHAAALDAGGKTIAVLASSLDEESIYPRANLALAHQILKSGGCLVSEQEQQSHPFRYQFPLRNRIISGLSVGILVIEADIKSGARITAYEGLKQSRDVFAVPGSIYSSRSNGTNLLIQDGAKLVRNAQDILSEYEHIIPRNDKTKAHEKTVYTPQSQSEAIILQNLTTEPKYIDFIVRQTNLPAHLVLATLTKLELRGIVAGSQGMFYLSHNTS